MKVSPLKSAILPLSFVFLAVSCSNPGKSGSSDQSQPTNANPKGEDKKPGQTDPVHVQDSNNKTDDCHGKLNCGAKPDDQETPPKPDQQNGNSTNKKPEKNQHSSDTLNSDGTFFKSEPNIVNNLEPISKFSNSTIVNNNVSALHLDSGLDDSHLPTDLKKPKIENNENGNSPKISQVSKEMADFFSTKVFEVEPGYKVIAKFVPFEKDGKVDESRAHVFFVTYKFKSEPFGCNISEEVKAKNKNYIRLENFSHIVANVEKTANSDDLILNATDYRLIMLMREKDYKNKIVNTTTPLLTMPIYERFQNAVNSCSVHANRNVVSDVITDAETRENKLIEFLNEELTSAKIGNLTAEFETHETEFKKKHKGVIFTTIDYDLYVLHQKDVLIPVTSPEHPKNPVRLYLKAIDGSFKNFLVENICVFPNGIKLIENDKELMKKSVEYSTQFNNYYNGLPHDALRTLNSLNNFLYIFGMKTKYDDNYKQNDDSKTFEILKNGNMIFKSIE